MNKTKIEWCDASWNPVTGCNHGCPYCYARKIAERFTGGKAWPEGFKPTFRPERLTEPAKVKTPISVFVCSMADLFGEWVPYEWQHRVFDACAAAWHHSYIFLTKNPRGMEVALERWEAEHHMMLDEHAEDFHRWWFGVSAGDRFYDGHYDPLVALRRVPSENLFVSFEPLLVQFENIYLDPKIKQVIIGAQTNPPVPVRFGDVLPIMQAADHAGAKVFMKNNLVLTGGWMQQRHELCWSMKAGVRE